MSRHHAGAGAGGIAIIGMACRLPGARNHREFWDNLCQGRQSIRFFSDDELAAAGVPANVLSRPDYVKAAPLLEDVESFDAAFFGYSPREAALIDPQQRFFLEVAWDTFEDAGYDPGLIEGDVGVFAGAGGVVTSYMIANGNHEVFPGQTGGIEHISNDKDFLSTRVSYKLDLTGPSLTVQTACSTSLVALHLACQSILAGECDMALAGASTIRIPHLSGYLAPRGGIYSSDGRCRAFDANGTGTIFGSGVAAVLLKDVADALADGDHIHAVIRSTAVNNDGGRKVSYTAPSVMGEARAMADALAVAGVPTESIRFVECHATGTTVGDPLEIQALTRAFRTRTQGVGFCAVGSAKTNIGHAEQAAGMAGLIKTALVLEHGVIPPTRVETPNPSIPFAGSPFFLNQELTPWPDVPDQPRRAAVNSLGIGGTNAFAVLEEAPPVPAPAVPSRSAHLLCLSAKGEAALRARAGQFADLLASAAAEDVPRICHTANVSRSGFPHRLALSGNQDSLRRQLVAYAGGGDGHGSSSTSRSNPAPIAFLCSGQGFQFPGMARTLHATQPTFRESLERCCAIARPHLELDLLALILGTDGNAESLHQTRYTQPALFALEVSLARMWAAWGITPAAVIGHSVGEISACCIAGVYGLEAAMELVLRRAALMQALPEPGGMLAAFTGEAEARAALAAIGGLEIAALNAPTNTVISGPISAIERAGTLLAEQGVAYRRLAVSHAFHSSLMEPMLEELDAVAHGLPAAEPSIPVILNRTGAELQGVPSPQHWSEHARGTVRFADGIRTLSGLGFTTFLEVGPGSGLLSMGRTILGGPCQWLSSLDPKREDWDVLQDSLRQLYLAGHAIRWREVDEGFDRRRLPLPTYPFQRKRHWLIDEPPVQKVSGASISDEPLEAAGPFERPLRPAEAWGAELRDHRIHGEIVVPTTLILTEALAEGRRHLGRDVQIENLTYHRALVMGPQGESSLKLVFTPAGGGRLSFRLLCEHGQGLWQQHAEGVVARTDPTPPPGSVPLPWREDSRRFPHRMDAGSLYAGLRGLGLDYGPSLRSVRELHGSGREAWTEVVAAGASVPQPLEAHPALLDACLHAYPVLAGDCRPESQQRPRESPPYLPIGLQRFRILDRRAVGKVFVHARLRPCDPGSPLCLDLQVHAEDGALLASFEGLSLVRVQPETLLREGEQILRRWLVRLAWRRTAHLSTAPATATAAGAWVLLADDGGTAGRIARQLEGLGQRCSLLPRHRAGGEAIDAAALSDLLRDLLAEETLPLRGVINAWPLDGPAMEAMTPDGLTETETLGLRSTLVVLRALEGEDGWAGARLWSLTRGAVVTPEGPAAVEAAQAAVSGLGRTLALEHPRTWGGVIDLPQRDDDIGASRVAREVLQTDGEPEIVLRPEGRYVARLSPWSAEPQAPPRPLRTDGVILVTGGLGMLGQVTCRWLIERHDIVNLLLTGRSGAGAEAEAFLSELRARGVQVSVMAADVSDPDDVARLLHHIDQEGLPLRGIVHSAGVLADGIASQITWEEFARGLAPKIHGSWLLHHLSEGRDLDLFLVHSSILSWTGSVGQGNYTAGNAFIDALIDVRRARGLPALAINWGPWAEAGMATHSGSRGEEIWRRLGVAYIERETGVRALRYLYDSGTDHGGLTLTDWQRYLSAQPASARLLTELLERGPTAEVTPSTDRSAGWRGRLGEVNGESRLEVLIEALCHQAALELGFEEPIAADQPLSELGLDSLISVNLANRIQNALGLTLPLVHLVQGPSVRELVDRLAADPEVQGLSAPALRSPEVGLAAAPPNHVGPAEGPGGNGSTRPRSQRSPGRWLVFPEPRPDAAVRLLCFPYAGAGAPVFQPWVSSVDPAIELVAVEPPGRAGRIEEQPLEDMETYIKELMPDLDAYMDKPIALFGHCQGGMNVYEVARAMVHRGVAPIHIFVSGARPPHQLFEPGRFEEALTEGLLKLETYDPLLPLAEQPEEVFSEALRHFDIGATELFLTNPELRGLVLPAVRADFKTLANYRHLPEEPWNVPITCLLGLNDTYVSRSNAVGWSTYTRAMFKVHYLDSAHYMVVEERATIIEIINSDLLTAIKLGAAGHDRVLSPA